MKFLDISGLLIFWNKIKNYISNNYFPTSELKTYMLDKKYTLDLTSVDSDNFYPVIFLMTGNIFLRCYMYSLNFTYNYPYNCNNIYFSVVCQGWNDVKHQCNIYSQSNYENNEVTIGSIGLGNYKNICCVWVRGGLIYTVFSTVTPTVYFEDYSAYAMDSSGNKKYEYYTVGPNLTGGDETLNVEILWQNDNINRDNCKYSADDYCIKLKQLTNINLNSIINTYYIYYVVGGDTTVLNRPTGLDTGIGFSLLIVRCAGSFIMQILTQYDNGISHYRTYNMNTKSWSNWDYMPVNCLNTTLLNNNIDLNDIKDNLYTNYNASNSNSCKNKPDNVTAFNMSTYKIGSIYGQILIDNKGDIYTRTYNNTWTQWRKMISEDEIIQLEQRITELENKN